MVLSSWQKVALLAKKRVTLNKFFVYSHYLRIQCQYRVLIHIARKQKALKINMKTLYDKRL